MITLACIPMASASNHTDDGLSEGAISGIIIGSIAGVILIGLCVWWYMNKGMGAKSAKRAGRTESYAASAGEGHELPMVALRAAPDDDL